MMRLRYGDNFAGSTQAIALWRGNQARRRQGQIPSRRPRAGLGADRGDLQGHLHRRLRRLQGCRATRPARRSRSCRATCSSPRRRSACRCSATAMPPTRSKSCWIPSAKLFPERAHLVGAYSLGKAQRVIAMLRQAGYDAPIYLHGAMEKITRYYQSRGIALGELRLVHGCEEGRACRHHHAGAAVGDLGSLDAALSRSAHGLCLGLDAGARPRAAARHRTAAGDFRSRRLGRAVRDDRRHRRRRNLGHAWPGRRAGALVQDKGLAARPLALVGYGDEDERRSAACGTRPRHEPLRRAARPPRLRARPQQQAAADHGLFSRDARSRSRLRARRDDRRAVVQAREGRTDPRPDRRPHRSGAVRAVL